LSIGKHDVNRRIVITFWDHCITNDRKRKKKPILCEVSGRILDVTGLKITIATWNIVGEDKPTQLKNAERFEVVRSCIIKYGWAEVLKWNDD